MAIISFNFSGWCRADIKTAFNLNELKSVDVSDMPAKELADKLNKGELSISFADVYAEAASVDNDISGYAAEEEDD